LSLHAALPISQVGVEPLLLLDHGVRLGFGGCFPARQQHPCPLPVRLLGCAVQLAGAVAVQGQQQHGAGLVVAVAVDGSGHAFHVAATHEGGTPNACGQSRQHHTAGAFGAAVMPRMSARLPKAALICSGGSTNDRPCRPSSYHLISAESGRTLGSSTRTATPGASGRSSSASKPAAVMFSTLHSSRWVETSTWPFHSTGRRRWRRCSSMLGGLEQSSMAMPVKPPDFPKICP